MGKTTIRKDSLVRAVEEDDWERVRHLLEGGIADIIKNYRLWDLMVAKAPVSIVRSVLQQIKSSEIKLHLPLYFAVRRGSCEIIRLLIKAGADVNSFHTAALHWASFDGSIKVAKLLLELGADVQAEDNQALHSARSIEMWQVLLDAGADIHSQQDKLIHVAVENPENAALDRVLDQVKFLIDRGADLTVAISVAKCQPDPEIYNWLCGVRRHRREKKLLEKEGVVNAPKRVPKRL